MSVVSRFGSCSVSGLVLAAWVFCLAETACGEEVLGLSQEPPAAGTRSVETPQGHMVPYTAMVPGTEAEFEMIPVPGGEFLLGSPEEDTDRREDEGPQVRVKMPPFWIGKCEITWAEYQAFMESYEAFKKLEELEFSRGRSESARELIESDPALEGYLDKAAVEVDGVTCPTPLYDPTFTYGAGEDPRQPAVTMTQFAARQYTKWLSGILGQQYRLPTEAEWEYAARAGSTSPYAAAKDAAELEQFAWYEENADEQTHEVGTKQPNAWGLCDMQGNVAEWVLDAYVEDHYAQLAAPVAAADAVAWPTELFPRVIRGGSWLTPATDCRCAARQGSDDPEWSLSDPTLPPSPWWLTEEPARAIGFRIVRPLEPMTAELRERVWEPDFDQLKQDVADRLDEGRAARAAADTRLPAAIGGLRDAGEIE